MMDKTKNLQLRIFLSHKDLRTWRTAVEAVCTGDDGRYTVYISVFKKKKNVLSVHNMF